jgi:hypothetical protein
VVVGILSVGWGEGISLPILRLWSVFPPSNFIPADSLTYSTGRNFSLAQDEVERTGFDKWLDDSGKNFKKVLLHFAVPPRNDDIGTDDVTVLEVDENFVLLEFSDGEVFWVQKELISSAGFS